MYTYKNLTVKDEKIFKKKFFCIFLVNIMRIWKIWLSFPKTQSSQEILPPYPIN